MEIIKLFSQLGIEIIKFNTVYYSKTKMEHLEEENGTITTDEKDKLDISGTEARELLRECKKPPSWFMRPEISKMIIDSIKAEEEVFVK